MTNLWTSLLNQALDLNTLDALSSTFVCTLGAVQVFVTASDGQPIDVEFLTFLAEKMVVLTERGWTDFFVGRFTDRRSGRVVVVSVQAVLEVGVGTMMGLLQGVDSAGQSFQNPGPGGGGS